MKRSNRRRTQKSTGVLLVLFVSICMGVVLYSQRVAAEARLVEPSSCGLRDFRCYAKFYAQTTYRQNPEAAFKDMKSRYNTDNYVKGECHQLSHIVGRTAFKKYGGLASAYEHGDNFCWSGFHHGVIEQAVGALGVKGIKAQANDICKPLADKRRYSFDHFNCVHGLGHGFMSVDGYELFAALKSCDLLSDSWDASSCYGGVYMENVMVAARENGTSRYLKPDDLLYPCNAVETSYKEQCYLMQSSYMLQQNGYNFAATFGICARADVDFVSTCNQSIGRDASGSSVSDAVQTKTKCDVAPNRQALQDCVTGSVKDFVSYFHSDVQARAYCNQYETTIAEVCNSVTTDYYRVF